MSKFFVDSDFDSLNERFATSEDDKIISARQYVVEQRMKPLNAGDKTSEGLRDYMKKHGLHPHWQEQHLTNVYWPFHAANGGYVDYLRMGYGKEETLVKDLAYRSGVFTEVTDFGTRDAVAFHCVTQLQLGLNYDGWWINLYINKKGWLEQYNFIEKIFSSAQKKKDCILLLEGIGKAGYSFQIYEHSQGDLDYDRNNATEFVDQLIKCKTNKAAFSMSIEKFHGRNVQENSLQMLDYLKGEYDKLMALYHFIAWHPKTNNCIGL